MWSYKNNSYESFVLSTYMDSVVHKFPKGNQTFLKYVNGTFAQISAKLDNLALPLSRNKVVLL